MISAKGSQSVVVAVLVAVVDADVSAVDEAVVAAVVVVVVTVIDEADVPVVMLVVLSHSPQNAGHCSRIVVRTSERLELHKFGASYFSNSLQPEAS
jgi:hypothetical protein